jgi:hypothetical protein
MRRPVRPTRTAYIQVNRHSMPGYAATRSEPFYSEIPDPPPAPEPAPLPKAAGTKHFLGKTGHYSCTLRYWN